MSSKYWVDRQAQAQQKLSNRSIRETEKQLTKYYGRTMEKVISDFESTYEHILNRVNSGKKPTPADLYNLDKYWKLQGQLKRELTRLGDRQHTLLSERFMKHYKTIYESISIPSSSGFSTVSTETAAQMIKNIWCADGKNWSSRIWGNTEQLMEELNETLIDCVVAGRKTTELKHALQERFNVSFSKADSLVRTEIAHIQTQAAQQRYLDSGIQYVEVWADEDERRCDVCGQLHEKRYPVGAAMPIPAHPRCRCCIIPVIDDDFGVLQDKRTKQQVKVQLLKP